MRRALEELLWQRYPGLYGSQGTPPTKSAWRWGFEHDGWFTLIDAVSATLIAVQPNLELRQVTEMRGTLRFYAASPGLAAMAAISIAGEFSGRICAETGQPGELGSLNDSYHTLAPELWAKHRQGQSRAQKVECAADSGVESASPLPRLKTRLSFTRDEAGAVLRERHPRALAQAKVIDFPPRLFDIVDIVVGRISRGPLGEPDGAVIRVDEIYYNVAEGLMILPSFASIRPAALSRVNREMHVEDRAGRPYMRPPLQNVIAEIAGELSGAISFAKAMSERMEVQTGRCGPVNDRGHIIHKLPADSGDALDRLASTRQVAALVDCFEVPEITQPVVYTRRSVIPTLEARRRLASALRDRDWQVVAPRVYMARSIFSQDDALPAANRVATALASQNRWRLMLPTELSRFFMGTSSRPDLTQIRTYYYDQPQEQRFGTLDLTFKPAPDAHILELNAAGQAVWHHVHQECPPSDRELLEDASFAASAWFSNPVLSDWLMEELQGGKLAAKELFLGRAIIAAVAEYTGVADKAPRGFDPAIHESAAPRIYGWSLQKDREGTAYLMAQKVENHPRIPDGSSLAHTSYLVWYDTKIGWARTRSRFYRLMGTRFR